MLLAALLTALGAAGGVGYWTWDRVTRFPKRFAVVEADKVFRSGEVSPAQLENVVRERGVRTVLSLLDPTVPESVAERAAAERLGVRWLNVPLGGDGASNPAQRELIRSIVLDASLQPLLVHCAAGANRTGLACGMYRLHQHGWTVEQVLAEMRRIGFDDLPKHENLRQSLAAEARLAAERRAPHPSNATAPISADKP